MTRHLLSIGDLGRDDLYEVMRLARDRDIARALSGRGAALIFEHPSARTRNAAELASVALGGHPVTMRAEEVGLDSRETAEDVARTMACMHALLGARVSSHSTLERMARAIDGAERPVPVVNLLSDREHPTQAVADLLTIEACRGRLEGCAVAYVGDANNVCRSLVGAAALTGIDLRVCAPPGYRLDAEDLEWACLLGGAPRCFDRPEQAVEGAEVIYTDVWVSMGQGAEAAFRRAAFEGYSVDERLVSLAAGDAVVLHCLPAHRGEEISAAVVDGPQSRVWLQAENRLHAMRGIFAFLLAHNEQTP